MNDLRTTKSFPIISSLTTYMTKPADNLINSMGVCVHLTYNNTAYYNGANIVTYLTNLGIRHIRDGVALNRPDVYPIAQAIAAAGIKTNMLIGTVGASKPTTDIQAQLAALKDPSMYGNCLISTLEAPNEYDGSSGLSYPTWSNNLYTYLQTVYPVIKADSQFGNLPYIGPSFGTYNGATQFSNDSLYPDRSNYMDAGNLHCYPGGRLPETNMPSAITAMASVSASKPVYATESGYHNAINVTNSANYGVSDQAKSIYMLRLYLEYFRQGIVRSFSYELFDEKPEPELTNQEEHYGLVALSGNPTASVSTWTQTVKPTYTSLQRLIALESDQGNGSIPTTLQYAFSGAPMSLHHMVLGRLDGSYDIIFWNAVPVHNDAIYVPYAGFSRTASYTVVEASQKNGTSDAYNSVGYTYPIGSIAENGDQDVEYAKYYQSGDGGDVLPADIRILITIPSAMNARTVRPHYTSSFTSLGRGQRILVSLGPDPTILRLTP